MRWSNRDREMARRHMSPGAKVGVFVAVLAIVGILGGVAWSFLTSLGGEGGAAYPTELVAGEEFKPGAVVDFNGTETTALLDGVTQKVQAQDPTDEWLAALPDADCDDANLCTAAAPNSATAPTGEGGTSDGNLLEQLTSRFGLTETAIASMLGFGLLAVIAYTIIEEDA